MLHSENSAESALPQWYAISSNSKSTIIAPPAWKVIFWQEQGDHIDLERVLMNFDPTYYWYKLHSGNDVTNLKLFSVEKDYKVYEYEGNRFWKKAKYYFIEIDEWKENTVVPSIKRLYLQTLRAWAEVIKNRLQKDPIFFGRFTAAYPRDEIVDNNILPTVKNAIQLYLYDYGFKADKGLRISTQSYSGYGEVPHGTFYIEGSYFLPKREGRLMVQFWEMPYGDQEWNDSFEINTEQLPSVMEIKSFINSLGYREGVEVLWNDLASFKLRLSKHLFKTPIVEYTFDSKSKFFHGMFEGEHKMTRWALQQRITTIKESYDRREALKSQL